MDDEAKEINVEALSEAFKTLTHEAVKREQAEKEKEEASPAAEKKEEEASPAAEEDK